MRGERLRAFFRGVGSLVDVMPVRESYGEVRQRFARRLPYTPGSVDAPPGVTGTENASVAAAVAWAEFLATHPDAAAADPGAVSRIEAVLDAAERTPPIVLNHSPVGHLWMDAVHIAQDRYRVRQRLAARGRQLLEQIRAADYVAA